HGRLDGPPGNAELLLREDEHVVPEPGFQVALHLREIEVRTRAARDLLFRVVEKEKPEIEERGGDRLAVDEGVPFVQMPASRADHQGRDLFGELIALAARRLEIDFSADRVAQVQLPLDRRFPSGGVRVLEIRHEYL